jgi:hypothetical protein
MVVFATVGGDENEIVKVEVKKATVCFFEDLSIKLAACAIFARRSVQPSPAAAAARGRSAITFPFRLHLTCFVAPTSKSAPWRALQSEEPSQTPLVGQSRREKSSRLFLLLRKNTQGK